MPDFAYVARDLKGKSITGTISANNPRDAAAQLGAKSLFPVSITVNKGTQVKRTRRVPGTAMAGFYEQLASLLRSGVPMLRALTVLSTQAGGNKTLRFAVNEIKSRVEEGDSLGDAMSRFPRIFNDMGVNMVRAGSEGGFLEDALERVGSFIEQQEEMKGKTAGALAYPVFVMSVGVIVVGVLLVFFVPQFDDLFAQMRKKGGLPQATEMLLALSEFTQKYWWIALGGLAGLAILLRQYLSTPEGKRRLDLVKIKTPMLGSVFLNLSVARFCRVLGTLLKNGVPLLRSLEISRQAAGNVILSESVQKASEEITAGERLAKQLEKSGHFPQTVVEMISIAEESNNLDNVLVTISDNLERTTFRRLETVVRLLEPVMLLLLASMVMFVVLALMLPIINSASAV
ncbi:MAG: type II secretion system F family protein [Planctomycetes bacterium]|nr:type II secretion system F family protein [Planctomycetota bacterium]